MKIEIKEFKDALIVLITYLICSIIAIQLDLIGTFIAISLIAFTSFFIYILIRLYFYFSD